ncbi:FAD/NAD(P)-binding protein [Gimesia maris]|uniref:FAD/NAD(P)-binding protein n=1 Tax=Gimesia maris TaxID=122 RepID=UPI003A94E326
MMTALQTGQRTLKKIRPAAFAPFKIAVVGCGPKGMYCLERLAYELARSRQQSEVHITIYEPAPFPGAGFVYHPRQPHHLRMNFASEFINVWPETVRRRDPQSFPTLVEWLGDKYPQHAHPRGFAPRAIVGEYLSAAFQKTLQLFPDFVSVTLVSEKVTGIQETGGRWLLEAKDRESVFDEVLLTTGHEGWRAASNSCLPSEQMIEKVFPVEQMLSPERIHPQSTVGIRGFALTFLDACFALTEGRGGKFRCEDRQWSYLPSGDEVQSIVPFSRTGHPMLAKPDHRYFQSNPKLEQIWEQGRLRMLKLKQPAAGLDFLTSIWPVILKTAEEALLTLVPDHQIGTQTPMVGLHHWFQDWSNRTFSPAETFQCLQQSYRIATGQQTPDEAWALGETFRQLYSALVRRISYGGLALTSWIDFQRHAQVMERLSFGPPAENTGRLIALIEAGLVNLNYLHADLVTDRNRLLLQFREKQIRVDRLINAVIPACDQFAENSLLEQLLSSGWIRRMLGAGGIAVDGAARPIQLEEQTTEGLAIIGRSTEGCVLGNDTLSRELHSCPDQWARSVCEQIAKREAR